MPHRPPPALDWLRVDPVARSWWLRLGITLGLVALALLLRLALLGILGGHAPYMTFFPAVMAAALLAGRRFGLLATALSVAVSLVLVARIATLEPIRWITAGLFIVVAALLVQMCAWMTDALRRAAAAEAHLRVNSEELERAAEHKLRLLDEREEAAMLLNTLLDQAPIGIAFLDRELRFRRVNPALARINGLPADDHLGKTVAELLPGIDPHALDHLRGVLERQQKISFDAHSETPAGPGERRYFATTFYPLYLRGGMIGVGSLCEDITDRHRHEQERERLISREREARAVAERGQQAAADARVRAEEAGRAKDEFLAVVSHELRTPLTPILGYARILRAGGVEPAVQARAVEIVERNARALAQLVEDLLDISRIISGKLRLSVADVDLPRAVHAALDTVRMAADARGIQLHVDLPELPTLQGDAARLQQVVWNLVSNAVKFTPRGGHVHVHALAHAELVELAVTDTGKGIAADFLPHVFERFRQAESGTTRNYGGLGLGLALVRHIVELHGGTVAAESAGEGLGARFLVRLPRTAPAPEPGAPAPAPQRRPGSRPLPTTSGALTGKRVLIVEDDTDTRELLRILLTDFGAEVELAASGEDGMRAFLRRRPDLLLSDIGMPGGTDGHALIRQIRQIPAHTPAVALTAYTRNQDRQQALAAGFDAHLGKPVDPADLLAALLAALASRS